jgi:hypothetical protein
MEQKLHQHMALGVVVALGVQGKPGLQHMVVLVGWELQSIQFGEPQQV